MSEQKEMGTQKETTRIHFGNDEEMEERKKRVRNFCNNKERKYLQTPEFDKTKILTDLMVLEGTGEECIDRLLTKEPDEEYMLTLDFLHIAVLIMGEAFVTEHLLGKSLSLEEAARLIRMDEHEKEMAPLREKYENLEECLRAAKEGEQKVAQLMKILEKQSEHAEQMYKVRLENARLQFKYGLRLAAEKAARNGGQTNEEIAVLKKEKEMLEALTKDLKKENADLKARQKELLEKKEQADQLANSQQVEYAKKLLEQENRQLREQIQQQENRQLREQLQQQQKQQQQQAMMLNPGYGQPWQMVQGPGLVQRPVQMQIPMPVREPESNQKQEQPGRSEMMEQIGQAPSPSSEPDQKQELTSTPEHDSTPEDTAVKENPDNGNTNQTHNAAGNPQIQAEERGGLFYRRRKEKENQEEKERREKMAAERRDFCINVLGNNEFSDEQLQLLLPCFESEKVPLSALQKLCNPNLPPANMKTFIRFILGSEGGENSEEQS